jgi:hypothetical protein
MKWMLSSAGALLCATEIAFAATNESVYVKAQAQSDMMITCTVLNEGPLFAGSSARKSYEVEPTHFWWSILHMKMDKTVWIYFDSTEYPEDLKSGTEPSYHKQDRFIAFLHYEATNRQFRIVRLDNISNAEQITKALKQRTEQAGGAYILPEAVKTSAHP